MDEKTLYDEYMKSKKFRCLMLFWDFIMKITEFKCTVKEEASRVFRQIRRTFKGKS
jgi:hypothetical protein